MAPLIILPTIVEEGRYPSVCISTRQGMKEISAWKKRRGNLVCSRCGKKGHEAPDCWAKQREEGGEHARGGFFEEPGEHMVVIQELKNKYLETFAAVKRTREVEPLQKGLADTMRIRNIINKNEPVRNIDPAARVNQENKSRRMVMDSEDNPVFVHEKRVGKPSQNKNEKRSKWLERKRWQKQ